MAETHTLAPPCLSLVCTTGEAHDLAKLAAIATTAGGPLLSRSGRGGGVDCDGACVSVLEQAKKLGNFHLQQHPGDRVDLGCPVAPEVLLDDREDVPAQHLLLVGPEVRPLQHKESVQRPEDMNWSQEHRIASSHQHSTRVGTK